MGISAYRLAKDMGLPQTWILEIIRERRRITADTALRLGKYFGVSLRFWLGLQDDYDLEEDLAAFEERSATENRSTGISKIFRAFTRSACLARGCSCPKGRVDFSARSRVCKQCYD